MNLSELLQEKLVLVVINNTVSNNSTPEQIIDATLNAWKMDKKRAKLPDYIIGIKHGIGVSCYKIEGVGIRKSDGRVFFSTRAENTSHMDLSHLVKGVDLKKMDVRHGSKEIQYINC